MIAPAVFDFIVIGAQKCGTTTLNDILSIDSRIALPVNKEAPYFINAPEINLGTREYFRKYYSKLSGKIVGKVTPQYMVEPELAARNIASVVPQAKIIAIIRDPIERAVSHYSMSVGLGIEPRGINEAIADSLESVSVSRDYPTENNSYVASSEYGRILDFFFNLFPRENILVLNFDRISVSQKDVIREVYAHIGLDFDGNAFEREQVQSLRRGGRWIVFYKLAYLIVANAGFLVKWFIPEKIRLALRFKITELKIQAFSPTYRVADLDSALKGKLRAHFEMDGKRLLVNGVEPYWLTNGRYLNGEI